MFLLLTLVRPGLGIDSLSHSSVSVVVIVCDLVIRWDLPIRVIFFFFLTLFMILHRALFV